MVCVLAWTSPGRAADFLPESMGMRGGFSVNMGTRDFYEVQGFANWNLPWGWDLGKEWHLQSRLELSVGWLEGPGDDVAMGMVGPSVVLTQARLPLSLEGGVSPTYLGAHDFDGISLGTDLQFTTHAGLDWDFARHWRVGYRFEHISNADLAPSNPGLNMHLFSLSYRF